MTARSYSATTFMAMQSEIGKVRKINIYDRPANIHPHIPNSFCMLAKINHDYIFIRFGYF